MRFCAGKKKNQKHKLKKKQESARYKEKPGARMLSQSF